MFFYLSLFVWCVWWVYGVYVCARAHVCADVYAHAELRTGPWVSSLTTFCLVALTRFLSLTWKFAILARLTGQDSQNPHTSRLNTEITGITNHAQLSAWVLEI